MQLHYQLQMDESDKGQEGEEEDAKTNFVVVGNNSGSYSKGDVTTLSISNRDYVRGRVWSYSI